MTLELIKSEILKLDRLSRIELISLLAESVALEERAIGAARDESGLTPEQTQEIERRIKLFKEGKMETVPAGKVTAKLIEKHGLQH